MDRHFLKPMNAQKLKCSVQCAGQIQLFVKNRDHEINRDRNPDLGLHCIGTCSKVMLDPQMSFYPAKKQFDLPSTPIKMATVNAGISRLLVKKTR